MFAVFAKDLWGRFGTTVIQIIFVLIAAIVLSSYLKGCSPFSVKAQQERVIEAQKEQINDLVDNNHQETKDAASDREARQESLDRLVEHLDTKKADEKVFNTITEKVNKDYIAPPAKKVVKASKPTPKPVTGPAPAATPSVNEEATPEEITQEIKRSQHNVQVLQSAIHEAYAKAVQMSTP